MLGHEFAGVIEQTGSDVSEYTAGTRVGVVPNAGCGRCDACIIGKSNYCADYTAFGIDRHGAHATHVLIPGRFVLQGNVIPLPNDVVDADATLLEPCSCVINGVRAAHVSLGDTVVIYGAGPMGLLHVMICRLAGAAKIIAIDPLPDRLARAKSLGCDVVLCPQSENVLQRVRDETEGRMADVVITACPVAEVQAEAVALMNAFGRLCLFGGLPQGSQSLPLDTNRIHYKNLFVTGTTGGSVEDYRIALRLVQSHAPTAQFDHFRSVRAWAAGGRVSPRRWQERWEKLSSCEILLKDSACGRKANLSDRRRYRNAGYESGRLRSPWQNLRRRLSQVPPAAAGTRQGRRRS